MLAWYEWAGIAAMLIVGILGAIKDHKTGAGNTTHRTGSCRRRLEPFDKRLQNRD